MGFALAAVVRLHGDREPTRPIKQPSRSRPMGEGVVAWWTRFVCEWFHGGGQIDRDPQGRINWRCSHCGRWSDNPVPLADEHAAIRHLLEGADNAEG